MLSPIYTWVNKKDIEGGPTLEEMTQEQYIEHSKIKPFKKMVIINLLRMIHPTISMEIKCRDLHIAPYSLPQPYLPSKWSHL